jgi:hypothetical protein
MKIRSARPFARALVLAAVAVLALEAVVLVAPASAQYSSSQYSPQRQDAIIKRAFHDYVKREPTGAEMRRYRSLMTDAYWTESDVREDVRAIRDSNRHEGERERDYDYDRVIRRAYRDILQREPDNEGLRHYRREMMDNGWTEQDVRRALRTSAEHEKNKQEAVDRMIRRAYQDILGREPDERGLMQYRNEVLRNGWTERQVRSALLNSREYREKNAMTREKAVEIVNRAYRSVLGREGDPAGMEGYVQRVLRDKWTEADVARELRKSDEYRNKKR